MRKVLRYIYRDILPVRLRNSLDLFRNLRTVQQEEGKARNILVLSPHPDDDILGCGGTLRLFKEKGARITSVYLTDGRKGNPHFDEEVLVSLRKEEAKRAADIIGIDTLIFFDNRDGELSRSPKTVDELSAVIAAQKPDTVFLPFLLDDHRDHMATNDLFIGALHRCDDSVLCYGYEIWTPLMSPNCFIDITSVLEKKKRALQEHKSQISLYNIPDAFLGLSRYRAILHGVNNGYAEAFVTCTIMEYRRLWEVIQ
ncbi:MAG: PIG-L deacetylase family protein [Nitrospirota bacterium]